LKLFFILLSLILCSFEGIAQQNSLNDTADVNRLNRLATAELGSNHDSAIEQLKQSIVIARKINYQQGLAAALLQQGHAYFFKGNLAEAKNDFDEASAIYEKLHDPNGLAECYSLYGRMYIMVANYSEALSYLDKALALDQRTGNQRQLTDCYKNLGIVYFSQGMLSKALDFYYDALFIAVKNHYDSNAAELNNNVGVILRDLGLSAEALQYFKKSMAYFQTTNNLFAIGTIDENFGHVLLDELDYDHAIPYIRKAYPIAVKLNNKVLLASVYTDRGIYAAHQNDVRKATKYLDTALDISVKSNIAYSHWRALIAFANVYNQVKDYKKALSYATEVDTAAKKLGNLYLRLNSAMALAKADSGLGDMKGAYAAITKYQYLKDGISNNASLQKLTTYTYHLDLVFEKRLLEQQKHEKSVAYAENVHVQHLTDLVFIVIVIGLVLIIGIVYLKQRKERNINKLLKSRNAIITHQKIDLDGQAEKLTELNSLKDRLIAILAHDLRGPLSTLNGLFDLLQDDSITQQELLDMIPSVIKKLAYTSDFLDTLLFWINSQMENFQSTVKPFSVAVVLNKTIQGFEGQFSNKGIKLETDIPHDLVGIADPDSIGIVVRNLVSNAIKFCGENDTIEVSAELQEHQIFIRVGDTGVGMTQKQADQLFKSKVSSQPGTSQETGTGLGLLFCKELVEKCYGKIMVKSTLGEGTEFVVTIPGTLHEI
jgi:two-component system, sensor histidine kinase and response regulator